jgi:hypothetical protein
MTTLSGTEINKKCPNKEFSPKPNVPYKLLFQEMNNNKSQMIITFTEENNIYPVERCFGFKPYEGYDESNSRFVCYFCYIDNSVVLHSCIPLVTLYYGKINSFDIKQIYLEDELIWFDLMRM